MTAPAMSRTPRKAATAPAGPAFTFSMPRSALQEALSRVLTVASAGRAMLPVMQCVLIESTNEGLTFTTSDLDHTVVSQVPGAARSGFGRAALPVKRFAEIVGMLPTGAPVTIAVQGNRAKITAARAKFDVVGLAPDEFPIVDAGDGKLQTTLDGRAFVGALQRVQAHVGVKGRGAVLESAFLEAATDGLFLVCSNRVNVARVQVTDEQSAAAESLIPKTAFAAIIKLFAGDTILQIIANEHYCRFVGTLATLTVRLTEGPYLPYRSIMGLPFVLSVTVQRAEFTAAVKRVKLVGENGHVWLRFSETETTIYGQTPDAGQAEDVVTTARTINDPAAARNKIKIDGDLLLDALNTIASDDVVIQIGAKDNHPVYVRDAKTPESLTVVAIAPLSAASAPAGFDDGGADEEPASSAVSSDDEEVY